MIVSWLWDSNSSTSRAQNPFPLLKEPVINDQPNPKLTTKNDID